MRGLEPLGTLYSKPFQKKGETGFYDLDIDIDIDVYMSSIDRRGYIIHMLSKATAEQCFLTGLPAHMWYFEFTTAFAREFGWDTRLNFDGTI